MKKSKRHHYIPQFMTKHFADASGLIHVYDKLQGKFYSSNPLNLFVETDRNTFLNSDGFQEDTLEKAYASLDSMFSTVLNEINSTNAISNHHFKLLLLFAYISKWRVRQYDKAFEDAKEFFSIDELGLGLKTQDNKRVDLNLEEYLPSKLHQEFKRILLAVQPFRFKQDYKKLLAGSFLIWSPYTSFIGDCPFNEATIIGDEIFEDFVFPIQKDLTLVYSSRIDREAIQNFLNGRGNNVGIFLKDFSIARDISMLDLAERNVGCCDAEYLKHLVKNYNEYKQRGSDTAYHLTVFNVLYRFREYAESA